MNNADKEKQKEILKFLNFFTEALGYSDDQPLCDVIKDLEEDGFMVRQSVKRLKKKIRKFSKQSKREYHANK